MANRSLILQLIFNIITITSGSVHVHAFVFQGNYTWIEFIAEISWYLPYHGPLIKIY